MKRMAYKKVKTKRILNMTDHETSFVEKYKIMVVKSFVKVFLY